MDKDDLHYSGRQTDSGEYIYVDNLGSEYTENAPGEFERYWPGFSSDSSSGKTSGGRTIEGDFAGCLGVLLVLGGIFWVASYLGLILAIVFLVIATIYSGFQILGGGLYVPCKLFELRSLLHFQDYSWGPRGILLIWHDHCAVMQAICLMQHERLAKKLQAVQAKGKNQLLFPILRRLPLICGAFFGSCLSMFFWFLGAPFIYFFKAKGENTSNTLTPNSLQKMPYHTSDEIIAFYNQERSIGKTMSVHRYYLGAAIVTFLMCNLGLSILCFGPLLICGTYSCRIFTSHLKNNDGHLGRGMMLSAYFLIYPIILGILPLTPFQFLSLPLLCLPIILLFLSLYARPANIFTRITVFLLYGCIMAVIGFAIFKLRLELPDEWSLEPQLEQAIKQLSNFVHSIWK